MINIDSIKKEFGSETILEDISFKVNSKEKIGLVGRNGHGKTTLFKILIGEEEPDSGNIFIPKNYSIGYIKQNLNFTEKTVLEEGLLGLPKNQRHDIWRLEKILFGLGFNNKMLQLSPFEISGGFQVRLNLAKTLVSNPNILLLDEPNNYLDILSIRWLSRFLRSWQGELILITHDKHFMDSIVTHVVGIHRKMAKKIKGKTGKYYSQIAYEEETYEKTRVNEEKKIKDMEVFINKFRAKARQGNLVQSRIKTLNKLETKNKLAKVQNLEFDFIYKETPAKVLFQANELSFGYIKGQELISNFSINVKPHDRICIIGKNGKGKTTLLKLLSGKLKPKNGKIEKHHLTEIGYYEQTNITSLNPKNTVLEEIATGIPNIDNQSVRNIAGMMMFDGDKALKKISVLSGGEKARVLLAKIIIKPINLLMLDEPTNHLDMESTHALLKAIKNFKGAVIIVTHNEDFLEKIAKQLIVFKHDKLDILDYGYKDFLIKNTWDEEGVQSKQKPTNKKTLSNKERLILKQELKEHLKPIKAEIKLLEGKIKKTEEKLEQQNNLLIYDLKKLKPDEITNISKDIHKLKESINIFYEKLEALYLRQEELENSSKT